MWSYLKQKGFLNLKRSTIEQSRSDLLEIYCSSDSQLTKQAEKAGLIADRFGLRQGDLRYKDGRCRLYDILMLKRPENAWLAPSCRAWCKWAQFNAMRSPELAQKVIDARLDEEVHLMLCAAVFDFQTWRKAHTHLEQPAGSEMLYQPELQHLYANMLCSRCDQCVAGLLTHPETDKPIKKGMQILTTSRVMNHRLEQLRCPGNHEHHQVAGSCQYQGQRINVSAFTELYTKRFAQNIVRSIQASNRVGERPSGSFENIFHGTEESEPETKRRRLLEKQSRPDTYPEPKHSSLEESEPITFDQIIKEATTVAPRVGKMILEGGYLFDMISQHFTNMNIRVVELCKGTDKYRKPPIRLVKGEAPFRRSFGLHRLQQSVFGETDDWESWETMSNLQLCRKSPPARVLVTVFANHQESLKSEHHNEMSPEKTGVKRRPEESDITDLPSKRHAGESVEPRDVTISPPVLNPVVAHHGPKFKNLSEADQAWLSKVHKNLGHPGTHKLKIALQQQGVKKEVLDAIDDFHCSTCHESQRPKEARPSALPEVREFNDCVGCDGIKWTSQSGKHYYFFHYIDAATNFHLANHTHQTDAAGAVQSLRDTWVQWAGPCKELIVDGASSFCSEHFSQQTQGLNIHVKVVAAYAHWQLGKTERHGEILQEMLRKYDKEHPITNSDEFTTALTLCCNAKNALARQRGYTPEILVLGKSRVLPGTNSQDEPDASHVLAECPSPEGIAFREQLAKRETARKAFITADNNDRIRRAILRKSRPHRGVYKNGDIVMLWKPPIGQQVGRWIGPSRVINQEDNHIVWITHLGKIFRAAPEHIRSLSCREAEASREQIEEQSFDWSTSVGHGVFRYEDLTASPAAPANPSTEGLEAEQIAEPNNETSPPVSSEINSDQPDAEPDYAGTIPSGDPPSYTPSTVENNLEENSPDIDPVEVPIPNDENDELFSEDYWIIKKNHVIRRHIQPRTKAYIPQPDDDCPIHLLCFLDDRMTRGIDSQGNGWKHNDQWIGNSTVWETDKPWTGVTVFTIHEEPQEEIINAQEEIDPKETINPNQVWFTEIFLTEHDEKILHNHTEDCWSYLATVAKRQRAEVKLKMLNEQERKEFEEAQRKELDQWMETGTVRRILRSQIPESNIMQCRWVHTWKDLDPIDRVKLGKDRKAKSRLVVMGFQDPNIEDIPRDSPTLQKESRSLLFQYVASRKWNIQSFDIRTAFLRGSRRDQRKLGIEPTPEMKNYLQLRHNEYANFSSQHVD